MVHKNTTKKEHDAEQPEIISVTSNIGTKRTLIMCTTCPVAFALNVIM